MLRIIDKVINVSLRNQIGCFLTGAYRTEEDGQIAEHILLYIDLSQSPCNLRINSACYTGDILGDSRCDCNWQLWYAMNYIHQENQGLIIYHMHHEGRGNGILQKLRSYDICDRYRVSSKEAYERIGYSADARLYRSSIMILQDLGITDVNLISNNPKKKAVLESNGFVVHSMIPVVSKDPSLQDYYCWKRGDFNHWV